MKEGWGGSGGREGRAGGGKYIGNELRSAKYHLKHSQQNFRMNFDSLTLPPGSWVCVCLCEGVGKKIICCELFSNERLPLHWNFILIKHTSRERVETR